MLIHVDVVFGPQTEDEWQNVFPPLKMIKQTPHTCNHLCYCWVVSIFVPTVDYFTAKSLISRLNDCVAAPSVCMKLQLGSKLYSHHFHNIVDALLFKNK